MKLVHHLLLLMFPLFLNSCLYTKESNSDYPKEYGKLKIAWRTPFKSDQLYGSRSPAIFDNKVVFSNYPAFGTETFFALDADTGKEQYWIWDDYFTSGVNNTSSEALPLTYDNILCIAPGNGLIGVDMQTGQTLWKNRFSSSGGSVKFENFAVRQGQLGDSSLFFKLIDLQTGHDRTIFKIDTFTTPYFSFSNPAIYREQNGDTLMYFGFSELFQQPDFSIKVHSKLYAYNLTTNSIIWTIPDIAPFLVVKNDSLFALNNDALYCLDRKTGNTIWKSVIPEKSEGYLHLYEDKLVITGQGSPTFVHAYNLSDGSPAWSIPFNGNTSEPLYYKGLMYFTCSSDGRLWAIKVSNGERIWHERCPDTEDNSDSHWSFGINVDPVRNKLYVASFTGAFCLEPAN